MDDDYKPMTRRYLNGKRICPECGRVLVKRTNRKTGQIFWACPGFFENSMDRCFFTDSVKEKA